MEKITKIYEVNEVYIAFVDMENYKLKGYSGIMSFVRGKKSADIKIKIIYSKLNHP